MDLTYYFVGFLIVIYLLVPTFLYLVTPNPPDDSDLYKRRRVIVLVLGDLNRSPRMNYHAKSLAQLGYHVDLCGYNSVDEEHEYVSPHELVQLHAIPEIKNRLKLPFLLFAVQKVILQHYYLYKLLKGLKGADFLLVQNPPSVPMLGVVRFYILFVSQQTKLVIDWHNLGYSILALKLGSRHPFVWLYRWYEKILGRRAFAHLTVTVTMAKELRNQFGMDARRIIPLHDRPAEQFQVIPPERRGEVIKELESRYSQFRVHDDELVVVTSTSYTPDEDLGVLLDALKTYDSQRPPLKKLRVIITGKGPMYSQVSQQLSQLELTRVSVHQLWLSNEDYPKMLGIADLGVSLHTSSSGWDLPMKVVDMFGCGVPVIALKFEALHELVKDLTNGLTVTDSDTLANALQDVVSNPKNLIQIQKGALEESKLRWAKNWSTKVGPLFLMNNLLRPKPQEHSSDSE